MLCCGSPGCTGSTTADPCQAGAVLMPQPSTQVGSVHFSSLWASELALPQSSSGGLDTALALWSTDAYVESKQYSSCNLRSAEIKQTKPN